MKKNAERVFKLSWSHLFIIFDGKPTAVFSQSAKCIFLGWRHWVTSGAHFKQLLCSSHGCVFTKIIMKYIYKARTFNLKNIDLSTQNRIQINYTSTRWDMSSGKWVTGNTYSTHTYTRMHTKRTHTLHAHTCACAHTHKHTCMHTHKHVSTRAHAHTDIHADTHTQLAQHVKQLKLRTRFVALV